MPAPTGLRIAQLANFVGPTSGGIRTAVEALGAGYAAAGAERLLVVPGRRDEVSDGEHGPVVSFRSPQVGGGYRLIVSPWRVAEVLSRFAPTSIEVNDRLTLVPLALWARRHDVGCVLFSHERLDSMLTLRANLGTGLGTGVEGGIAVYNRLLARRFDAIVTASAYAAEGFPLGSALHRVPLGVDLDTFHPSAALRADVVRRPDELRLVHAGRLSREKSPLLAVRTAVALHRRGLTVRLDVYGSGPHADELHEAAADAPVHFHGHVADRDTLAAHLAAADVALSVCPAETFGLAILESLACGTPVVTADVGGGRELVDDASGAWAPPDPEYLADAVLRVAARDVVTRRALARRRAESFPWSATVARMIDVHASLAPTRVGLTV